MSDFNYTNVITTIGTLGTLFLIGWNVYIWNQKKKQDEKNPVRYEYHGQGGS